MDIADRTSLEWGHHGRQGLLQNNVDIHNTDESLQLQGFQRLGPGQGLHTSGREPAVAGVGMLACCGPRVPPVPGQACKSQRCYAQVRAAQACHAVCSCPGKTEFLQASRAASEAEKREAVQPAVQLLSIARWPAAQLANVVPRWLHSERDLSRDEPSGAQLASSPAAALQQTTLSAPPPSLQVAALLGPGCTWLPMHTSCLLTHSLDLQQPVARAQADHPALQLLLERLRSGSRPGARRDSFKLGLAVEGGGLRGCVTAGGLRALHELGAQ